MTTDEIRVEILKLAHRHDLEPQQVVERAKVLEAYVTEGKAPPLGLPKRDGGNPSGPPDRKK